jgi:hypothetical protein
LPLYIRSCYVLSSIEFKTVANLIEWQRAAMHYFSATIETRAKMRRATPTVSGMQRAGMPRRSSPVLFRLFSRGEIRTGLEAVAEKKRFACSGKSCADSRRRTGKITGGLSGGLSGGITGEDQAAIVARSRAFAGILSAVRV